ncbi:MAG: lipoprotein-releasing ABC transporter permease subunit [Pseudomonadota bacterium]
MSHFTSFVGLRYAFAKQRSGFSAFVSIASMLGMTLGVATLITVLSVMNGFGGELRSRILALVPHAYVEFEASPQARRPRQWAQQWQESATSLLEIDQVIALAPFHSDTVLIIGPYAQVGATLSGIDPVVQSNVSALGSHMVFGELADLRSPNTMILGASLARSLGVVPGDEVRVVLPRVTTTPVGVFPRSKKLLVVGTFEVGAEQDSNSAYTSLASAGRLFGNTGRFGFQVQFDDLWSAPGFRQPIEAAVSAPVDYKPWSETQGSLFRAIRMEKITVTVLLLGVVFVAAFNIIATLVMAVTERRADIAVLRTMGSSPGEVARVFLLQGTAISVLGIGLGVGAGCLLAVNIASLVEMIEQWFGARIFDPRVYYISRLPSELQSGDVVVVAALALGLSALAILYPAWRASKVPPAEVLRYE